MRLFFFKTNLWAFAETLGGFVSLLKTLEVLFLHLKPEKHVKKRSRIMTFFSREKQQHFNNFLPDHLG